MRPRLGLLVLLLLTTASAAFAQAPPAASAAADKPVRVAYYYKVRWGFQDEFERLFLKNHYPVLQAQVGGRLKSVNMYKPMYHGDGRADWTFAVVIVYQNWASFLSVPGAEAEITKKLYPDQDAFKKEEARRFEILDAHWDVPLAEVEAPKVTR
jgi:hypothetical protein